MVYKTYDELPLFIDAKTVSRVLGISRTSAYELMHQKTFPTQILIPNKKQTIFAVYFPQYCVVVLARRQPCRVLRLVLRKISSQNISLLSIRN